MFFRPIRLRSGQALALRMSPGPLLVKDMNPDEFDYDNYWDEDIKAHLSEFSPREAVSPMCRQSTMITVFP